jgi:hypothetical protein
MMHFISCWFLITGPNRLSEIIAVPHDRDPAWLEKKAEIIYKGAKSPL